MTRRPKSKRNVRLGRLLMCRFRRSSRSWTWRFGGVNSPFESGFRFHLLCSRRRHSILPMKLALVLDRKCGSKGEAARTNGSETNSLTMADAGGCISGVCQSRYSSLTPRRLLPTPLRTGSKTPGLFQLFRPRHFTDFSLPLSSDPKLKNRVMRGFRAVCSKGAPLSRPKEA